MRFFSGLMLTAAIAAGFATPARAQPQGPCFYVLPNFQGQPFCIQPNQRVPTLAALDNRLMSVRIPPGLRVTMCSEANFAGTCAVFTDSVATFAAVGAAGQVSSVFSDAGGPGPRPGPAAGPPPRGPQQGMLPPGGPPPRGGAGMDAETRGRMMALREECEDGDTKACVRLGIIIGENRERRAQWSREHPELFFWER